LPAAPLAAVMLPPPESAWSAKSGHRYEIRLGSHTVRNISSAVSGPILVVDHRHAPEFLIKLGGRITRRWRDRFVAPEPTLSPAVITSR